MENSLPKIAGEAFNVELADNRDFEGISDGKYGEKFLEITMGKSALFEKQSAPG